MLTVSSLLLLYYCDLAAYNYTVSQKCRLIFNILSQQTQH